MKKMEKSARKAKRRVELIILYTRDGRGPSGKGTGRRSWRDVTGTNDNDDDNNHNRKNNDEKKK